MLLVIKKKKIMAKATKKAASKKATSKKESAAKNKNGVKNSLVNNINAQKKIPRSAKSGSKNE